MHYYPPKGQIQPFKDEDDWLKKGNGWGLMGKTIKHDFLYKTKNEEYKVTIKGYEVHGDHETVVVEFEDGNVSCIHPAYLKEMQSSTFGKESLITTEEEVSTTLKTSKPKKEKMVLPTDKVRFNATVLGFSTKPNPFSSHDETVVLYEKVEMKSNPFMTIEKAWSGYGKSLEKMALSIGDEVEFEAKIVANKFNDAAYKLNNVSKIEKK